MKTFWVIPIAASAYGSILLPIRAQSADPSAGRRIAEMTCSACHQIGPGAEPKAAKSGAPSFVDISRMPSTNELAIKVFLRSSHANMPNIILSPEEIDSIAAYIVGLAKK